MSARPLAPGYHLRAKQKPPPTFPPWGCQQWLLSEHAPCSIFTSVCDLHLRHQRIRLRASVSGLTNCVVVRPHTGQMINPFFNAIVSRFFSDMNPFVPPFSKCAYYSTIFQVPIKKRIASLNSGCTRRNCKPRIRSVPGSVRWRIHPSGSVSRQRWTSISAAAPAAAPEICCTSTVWSR